MVNYYDGILACTGLLLLAGVVTALLIGPFAVMGFAAVAVGLIGHAMFVRPPIDVQETSDALEDGSPVPSGD